MSLDQPLGPLLASKGPINGVVLGSGSGSNLKALLEAQEKEFKISLVATDRSCGCLTLAEDWGVPGLLHDFQAFFAQRGVGDAKDPWMRREYDRAFVEKIHQSMASRGLRIDFIFLAGYMRLLTDEFLSAFPQCILNVHPADLSVLGLNGRRAYVGANGVWKALKAGESHTRSCVLLVNEEVDGGQVLASGPWLAYEGANPPTKASAKVHQEIQKEKSDWPVSVQSLRWWCQGRFSIDPDSQGLRFDGEKLGPAGREMGERPCAVSSDF